MKNTPGNQARKDQHSYYIFGNLKCQPIQKPNSSTTTAKVSAKSQYFTGKPETPNPKT